MAKIAQPMDVNAFRQGDLACLRIEGGGTLKMPRDAAHQLARQLMAVVAEIDGMYPRPPRPAAQQPRHW